MLIKVTSPVDYHTTVLLVLGGDVKGSNGGFWHWYW